MKTHPKGRLLLLLAILAIPGATEAQQSRNDRATRASGEAAYLRVGCDSCHGTVGHGGAAPKLAPDTLPLPAFEIWVRRGSPNWGIIVGMPAFHEGVLTDEELEAIHAYLSSLPEPKTADAIPLLGDAAD